MTLTATRDALDVDKKWYLQTRVERHDGEDSHWSIGEEGQVYLSVKTLRSDTPIHAIWSGGDVGNGGAFYIPDEGVEVGVAFDDGEFEGDAFVVRVFGTVPAAIAPGKLLLISPMTEIRDEDGEASALPTMADFNALKSVVNSLISLFNAHVHPDPASGFTGTPTASGSSAGDAVGTQTFRTR